MGGAISICAENDSAEPIRELWREVARLESSSSMEAVGYPPHITFIIYQKVAMPQLQDTIKSVFNSIGPLRITFDKIKIFDNSPLVLWASPASPDALFKLHEAIHSKLNFLDCDEYYQLENWVPHCTLGTQISADNRTAAITLANKAIKSFDVIFDCVDCVSFPPVKIESRLEL